MKVTFVPNHRLSEFATEQMQGEAVLEQWDNGTQTAVIWREGNPAVEDVVARWHRDAGFPTRDFHDALVPLSQHFGLNIPCVQ